MEHTFVICAYRESPYLEACICSLLEQSVPSRILLSTSTPNEFIRELGRKYGLPLFVNTREAGITQDWNFAYSQAHTRFVTLAHQDDVYRKDYTAAVLRKMKQAAMPQICFTNYTELHNAGEAADSRLLRVKRLLLLPLKLFGGTEKKWMKRQILAFGNAVCCPSVTFCTDQVAEPVFTHHFVSNGDWEAWERLSRQKGTFLYCPQPLMSHRIHNASATAKLVQGAGRRQEDYEMFQKFWPRPMAKLLSGRYQKGEKENLVKND